MSAPVKIANLVIDNWQEPVVVRDLWRNHGDRIEGGMTGLFYDSPGSWNIGPECNVASLVAARVLGDRQLEHDALWSIADYVERELHQGPGMVEGIPLRRLDHGGWGGKEPVYPWTYPWPCASLALACHLEPGIGEAGGWKLLEGVTLLMSLFAVPGRQNPMQAPIACWMPAVRSYAKRLPVGPSAWLSEVYEPGAKVPRAWTRSQTYWPYRVLRSTRPSQNRWRHPSIPPVYATLIRLQELGCHLRWTLHVWRWADGSMCAWADRNINPFTPPVMGTSCIASGPDAGWHLLQVHPDGWRASGGGTAKKKLGITTATMVTSAGVPFIGCRAAGFVERSGMEPVDVYGKIPIPAGEPSIRIVIGPDGIKEG